MKLLHRLFSSPSHTLTKERIELFSGLPHSRFTFWSFIMKEKRESVSGDGTSSQSSIFKKLENKIISKENEKFNMNSPGGKFPGTIDDKETNEDQHGDSFSEKDRV